MGFTGCYSAHIHCEVEGCERWRNPDHYTGHSRAEVIREARKDGWLVNLKGQGGPGTGCAYCPEHSGKPIKS